MKRLFLCLTIAIAMFACGSVLGGGSVLAAGIGTCADYTQAAVKAAHDVRALKCGYDLDHPQWSTDPHVHRRWCLKASTGAVGHERMTRKEKLEQCSTCRSYADSAMAAVKINKDFKCGFSGPRWSDDENAHFRWCMELSDHSTGGLAGLGGVYKPMSTRKQDSLDPESGARAQAAKDCIRGKQGQGLAARPPQIKMKPSNSQTGLQRRAPKSSSSTGEAVTTIQRSGPKGTTTVDQAVPCLPGAGGTPCKPTPAALSPGLLDSGPGFLRQGPAASGSPSGGSGGVPPARPSGNLPLR